MKNILRISGLSLFIFLIHSCMKNDDKAIKDSDGNIYTSVQIGTQVWIKENLTPTIQVVLQAFQGAGITSVAQVS